MIRQGHSNIFICPFLVVENFLSMTCGETIGADFSFPRNNMGPRGPMFYLFPFFFSLSNNRKDFDQATLNFYSPFFERVLADNCAMAAVDLLGVLSAKMGPTKKRTPTFNISSISPPSSS